MGVAEIRKDVLGKAVDAAIDKNIARGLRQAYWFVFVSTVKWSTVVLPVWLIGKRIALCRKIRFSVWHRFPRHLPVWRWPRLWNSENCPWMIPFRNGFHISHQSSPTGFVPVITIRDLLCHMSGLDYRWAQKEDGPYAKAGVSDGLDITGLTLEENLKRLASAPLCFAPGSSWLYSLGPDVLGAVVAKVQGTDFRTALAELVTKPLGMTDTAFMPVKAIGKEWQRLIIWTMASLPE